MADEQDDTQHVGLTITAPVVTGPPDIEVEQYRKQYEPPVPIPAIGTPSVEPAPPDKQFIQPPAPPFDPWAPGTLPAILRVVGLHDPANLTTPFRPPQNLTNEALGALAARLPLFATALKKYQTPGPENIIDQSVQGVLGFLGLGNDASKSNQAGQVLAAGLPLFGAVGKVEAGARGFYSRLDDVVERLPNMVAPAKLLSAARQGTSAEEVAERGLIEFAQKYGAQPIPKAEILAHLQANPLPQVTVTTLRPQPSLTQEIQEQAERILRRAPQSDADWRRVIDGFRDQQRDAERLGSNPALATKYRHMADDLTRWLEGAGLGDGPTHYNIDDLNLPGGDNYKETLFKLGKPTKAKAREVAAQRKTLQRQYDALYDLKRETPVHADRLALENQMRDIHDQMDALDRATRYRAPHFEGDDQNLDLLLHTRSDEREIPGLGKGTFVQEIQSDLHQAGAKLGYREAPVGWTAELEKHGEGRNAIELWKVRDRSGQTVASPIPRGRAKTADEAMQMASATFNEKRIPDAPFKESWPDLALKQHLFEVAGRDDLNWLAFTDARTQIDRYKLEKHFSEIHLSGTNLKGYGQQGEVLVSQTGVTPEKLRDWISNKLAKKLLAQPQRAPCAPCASPT